ncbi:major facilitator superfamily domain-containing protein [Mycena olivaceomarginata]|nr:major facilitator superfamily domain-containing protein [Mycena olivaceomarginata]
MSMMPIQDSQESVDALPKSNDMELAHRIPLPASTSTFFLSSDTPSHLDSTDNPVSSSNSRNILRNMNESALPPVDKGLRAWSFLAAAFMIEAIVWGFPNAYGIFLDAYLQVPRYASQKNAASLLPLIGRYHLESFIIFIPGIYYSSTGLFINPIATRYPQHRRNLSCGALFGASYATKIFQLVLLQGVLYAVGGSLLYQPCISYMSEWFVARRGMANGILFAGTAAGGLLLPLSLPRLMSKYGPSKTLRILAVGTTILLFPLLPFLKGRLPQTRVRIQGPVPRGVSGTRNWMRDRLFWIFLAVNTLQGFAYFIPIIYLPSTCNNSSTTSTYRNLATNHLKGASVVGRLTMGYLSDSLNPWILALTTLFTTSVATFVLWGFVRPLANDDPAMSTTIYGYLLLTRGVGNIIQSHNITSSPERTGFDVGDGRFEKMIIYVGTCFAGAAGAAALGLTMDARNGRQLGNRNSE